jgi:hypothetical protein
MPRSVGCHTEWLLVIADISLLLAPGLKPFGSRSSYWRTWLARRRGSSNKVGWTRLVISTSGHRRRVNTHIPSVNLLVSAGAPRRAARRMQRQSSGAVAA